jgi:T4 gene Gp59 loader of gp41 DNA helicase C-term/T4 gene Gp59 loader of gp41 DNA helicase
MMTQLSPYGAYQLYMAVRSHFMTDSYDFFKYQGKLTRGISREAYQKRPDKQYFEMVSRTLELKQLRDLYISHFLVDRYYPADFIMDDAKDVYNNHKKHLESLSYIFKEDLTKLSEKGIARCFKVSKHEYPYIVLLHMRDVISIETMVILDDLVHFIDKFDKFYADDYIWRKISRKIKKYKPFLKYDKAKMKNILKGVVNEQRETPEEISTKE